MPDGLLRTGDIAMMDRNGFVLIVGGKNNLAPTSGFKVYANAVEEIVAGRERPRGGRIHIGAEPSRWSSRQIRI